MKQKKYQLNLTAALLVAAVLIAGCSSDIKDPVTDDDGSTSGDSTGGGTTDGNSTDVGSSDTTGGIDAATNGTYSLVPAQSSINLVEGTQASVALEIQRSDGYDEQVTLALEGQSAGDLDGLSWEFSDTRIATNDDNPTLTFEIGFSVLPIQRQTRTLRLIGTDGNNQSVAIINLEIEPTSLPDVYLLVGQSNMVGFSEALAKQAEAGGEDEPNERIQQLNVTGNDQENFDSIEAFTSDESIAVPSPRLTVAIDPLHDGFDSRINGKEGSRVGLGLSFAKRAIFNTQASIYLVPAAWSDSGFCRRPRKDFEGLLGWNTAPTENPALSGDLLYKRAVARANLTLRETGGILRGILWHQGEADSSEMECAVLYEQNLEDLVSALRTNIIEDPRGPTARGPDANVPFVVGTMSKGGGYDFLPDPKLIVDNVHRNIKENVPYSAYVNNDDLVPPAYPCGEGDCIHFGSTSYRLMGSRYYDFLLEAAVDP